MAEEQGESGRMKMLINTEEDGSQKSGQMRLRLRRMRLTMPTAMTKRMS
jgi:hypothetical protein